MDSALNNPRLSYDSQQAKAYIHHYCVDTRCCQEDLSGAIGNNRDRKRKRYPKDPVLSPIYDIYIYIYIYHHHYVVRLARISLTLSLHVSLSFIASVRSLGLHPVSSHSCCMNVRAGRPAFNWLYAGVHRSTSLTISSLLFQQCPACLVHLAYIVFVIGGRWPNSWRLVGCCCQDLFNVARNILV